MKNFNPIVEKIYHKTKDNDLIVLGYRVYSGRYRIQFTKKEHMNLVAKLHQAFVNDFNLKEDVLFNKNAGPLCLYRKKMDRYITQETHYFDIKHCQICFSKIGCYPKRG